MKKYTIKADLQGLETKDREPRIIETTRFFKDEFGNYFGLLDDNPTPERYTYLQINNQHGLVNRLEIYTYSCLHNDDMEYTPVPYWEFRSKLMERINIFFEKIDGLYLDDLFGQEQGEGQAGKDVNIKAESLKILGK